MDKKETIIQTVHQYSARINVTLGGITDLADSQIRDCIEAFKKRGIFRQELKRHANAALRESERVHRSYRQNTKANDLLYLDFLDAIQDDIKADAERLYFAIKLVFDRRKEQDTDLKTKVLQASYLTEMNERGYLKYKEILEKATHAKLSAALWPINPEGVMHEWQRVADIIFNNAFPRDITEDPSVAAGMKIITGKLFDLDWLEEKAERIAPNENN